MMDQEEFWLSTEGITCEASASVMVAFESWNSLGGAKCLGPQFYLSSGFLTSSHITSSGPVVSKMFSSQTSLVSRLGWLGTVGSLFFSLCARHLRMASWVSSQYGDLRVVKLLGFPRRGHLKRQK